MEPLRWGPQAGMVWLEGLQVRQTCKRSIWNVECWSLVLRHYDCNLRFLGASKCIRTWFYFKGIPIEIVENQRTFSDTRIHLIWSVFWGCLFRSHIAIEVGRRMWLIFDFRDKVKRLQHGTTYDSSVLLGRWERNVISWTCIRQRSFKVKVSILPLSYLLQFPTSFVVDPRLWVRKSVPDAGGREGVLLYALWFQWAIQRYLDEKVMDDEQSIIEPGLEC